MSDATAPRPALAALHAFAAVARHGSMTAAAEALGVTVSAVSHQVASLERVLQAQLLARGSRPVALTALGRQYAQRLAPAFAQIEQATDALFSRQLPHQVRLTTYPLFAVRWLLPRLGRFHAQHPDIEVALVSTNRVLSLATGEADLALRVEGAVPDGAEAQPLFTDEAVVACAPGLLPGGARSLAALQRLPLIADPQHRGLWPGWLARQGVRGARVRPARLFDDALAALEAAVAGAGAVLTLRSMVADDLRQGQLVLWPQPGPPVPVRHVCLTAAAAAQRPAVQVLRGWLLAQAAEAQLPLSADRRAAAAAAPARGRAAR